MRSIKKIHAAVYEPISDLITYRAMPTATISMNAIDPFIFLNHHGWQQYPPNNHGLPFGPHPHRGFETITFILEGELTHRDSNSGESTIHEGGVQWMVAGSGLVHAEVSSAAFKSIGGPLEILQLWVNLPSKYKMVEPFYTGLQQAEIPVVPLDGEKVTTKIIFGEWNGKQSVLQPFTDIHLAQINYDKGGETAFEIDEAKNIFCYVVKGSLEINGTPVSQQQLVEFDHTGTNIQVKANEPSIILFGHATPFNEPFVAYGPFVMNTREEIHQAYEDYNNGKFGVNQV